MVSPLPQDVGASSCTLCSPGYYCDNATTSLVDMHRNKVCPAGTTCAEGGHAHPPNLLLNACPLGHYCLAGDEVRVIVCVCVCVCVCVSFQIP